MGFYKKLKRVLKGILEIFPLNSTVQLAHHAFNTRCLFNVCYVDAPNLHTQNAKQNDRGNVTIPEK